MGKLITIAELAMRSATCEATWRRKIASGELPVVRIGRSIRIAEDVAELILREGTRDEGRKG